MREIDVNDLFALKGQELGVSDWLTVDQERIDRFAEATGDHQWIHVDVERARKEMPGGKTIGHGYLTLSLLPQMAQQIYRIKNIKAALNYGLNKLRFTNPVPEGSRVRLKVRVKDVNRRDDGRIQLINEAEIAIEGQDRPACIAETVTLYLPS